MVALARSESMARMGDWQNNSWWVAWRLCRSGDREEACWLQRRDRRLVRDNNSHWHCPGSDWLLDAWLLPGHSMLARVVYRAGRKRNCQMAIRAGRDAFQYSGALRLSLY